MPDDPATDEAAQSDGGVDLDLDEILSLLSERYRRHALACLDGQPEPIPIERLTDQVAGREFQRPPDDVSMITRTQIATALHHNHLPKLEESGVLTYDSDEGEVTAVAVSGTLASFLDKIRRHEG